MKMAKTDFRAGVLDKPTKQLNFGRLHHDCGRQQEE